MPDKDTARLLVVDDEEMNRDLLSRRLVKQGYQVLIATGGAEALDLVRREPIDLVLLDVMMPEIDGLEVLTQLRETHALLELPIIMVTARDQGGDVAAALQLGANDHVSKPINFTVLFARIQTHLAICAGAKAAQVKAASAATSDDRSSSGSTGEFRHATATDLPTISGDKPLVGDYELLGEIGKGGMGVVYKARHVRMNRVVALKVIDRERLRNPDAVRRFYQEVEAAARLHHPNVVIAYDAGQAGDTHYFAMEYVEGEDLDRYLREHGPLPVGLACDFVRQTALGLQHAHESGLVHRDIKPSNLIVEAAGKIAVNDTPNHADSSDPSQSSFMRRMVPPKGPRLKILDMGLARLYQPDEDRGSAGELTREGRVVGSVDYMAPEQWMNASKVDIRADLYSLGCTFYFLLTGVVPFPGDEPMEKMLKHHLDTPKPVEELRKEVPTKVAGVVRRLMAKRREDRYQTPAELAMLMGWICQAEFGGAQA
jgi:serine/threonine protein kinase/CheY-like chemotaxis protein